MYKIYFYRDKRGRQPVYDYLMGLASRKDKNSRIKLNKHNDYMQALARFGLQLVSLILSIYRITFGSCGLCVIEVYLRYGK